MMIIMEKAIQKTMIWPLRSVHHKSFLYGGSSGRSFTSFSSRTWAFFPSPLRGRPGLIVGLSDFPWG